MVFFQRLPIYDFKTLLLEDNFNVPKLKIRGFYEKGGSEVSLVEIRYSSNIRKEQFWLSYLFRSRKLSSKNEVISVISKLRQKYPELISFSLFSSFKYKLHQLDDGETQLLIHYDFLVTKDVCIQLLIPSQIIWSFNCFW